MPKGDAVEMDGTVIDALPNSQFTVRLDNGHELLAYTGGRMRRFRLFLRSIDYPLTRLRISRARRTEPSTLLRSGSPRKTPTGFKRIN